MQYIACHEVVHRDLAARNVLVFEDLNPADPSSVRVKVSDFGLSRPSCYYQRTATGAGGDALPVRYMPPEAIQRNKWSEKSDVWAFGVLLWEVATLGMIPYDSLGVFVSSDAELKAGVCGGKLRLPRPEGLPEVIWCRVMEPCWAQRAAQRPTFAALRSAILEAQLELHAASVTTAPVVPAAPSSAVPPSPAAEASGGGSGPDLLRAADNGEVEEVRAELAAGAPVNFKDSDGYTALI
uniref:Protein kinase domain-containing protein n=1 Tax=Pyramimonas obovata TaxID=1411642 RepID=A0A7S0RWF4_9CHLO|mmetsp:Transcript_8121/g.16676  ORF Transcript_8121/g.16676 Transcript_8121/m.16676 type:complete len:238 (+) Transcript_8121:75-788(+)